jgi:hypothetical protein
MTEVKYITWAIGFEIMTKYPCFVPTVGYRMCFLRFGYIILLLILSFKKFILHLCMNLKQTSSKVFCC